MSPEEKRERNRLAQRRYKERNRSKIRLADNARKKTAEYRAKSRAYLAAHPEKKKQYAAKYRVSGRAKEHQRKHRYGLPIGGWQLIAEAQQYCCAACGLDFGDRSIAVDHDHDTGIIRGLVHRQCNSMMGLANDSPDILERAAAYLRAQGEKK